MDAGAADGAAAEVEARDDLQTAVAAIGVHVRRERKRRQLSVAALSERAGVSFGLISEVERGLGNPSLQTLQRLGKALDLPLSQLLAEPGGDPMVVRAGERHVLPSYGEHPATRQVRRELLTPRGHTNLQLIRSVLPPGFTNDGSPFRHLGTEAILVEEGRLIVVHGNRTVELEAGDAMTYGCSTSHYWANGHDGTTIVLGAVSPFEE
ncbi:helix-turn-helix domain-containing protein [Nocardioides sp.]|uniref:helix-turn-helix domain-containing protein n=1 Tax=Nocardioides sp. TaxID=35761 RepID=UPI003527056F